MMANEPDSKIPNNGPISTLKRPSNGHLIPPFVDTQSLMQQRLSEILACGSPGSLFNDPISSDVKLTLSSKDGLSVCMNVHRQILVAHSRFFADKLLDTRRKMGQQGQWMMIISSRLGWLMYCKDLRRKLMEM
ncbi:hypothetical protein QVD17_19639 [Tagetes erecta]|uniref:BTB domain-containing protein n=1 Tax=Tagetes erecta TaxID=13708 RepID=A0AAD8KJY6_TARER|nr:hypothetical protein QVD17_19639 [Tagetes erecta]